ncbi:MAG TPA: prolyl oligopeptidase family serine peptidase [Armatimonadota bacterium]|jgi:pimeloyl-ACP methyl ester carboxylesterase
MPRAQVTDWRFPLLSLLACLAMLAVGAATIMPGRSLQSYTSTIDDSTQIYGLYVPTPFIATEPHPVIFMGHGFRGRASDTFSSYQQQCADACGLLLVQLDGRGNTFYDGVGETDFFEVLRELRAKFILDENRLYLEGASMGATGAYRLGIRHPDVFAAVAGADGWTDYQLWHAQWYGPTRDPGAVAPFRMPNLQAASCVDIADNARWLNLYMIAHDSDTTVPHENAFHLRDRLDALQRQNTDGSYRYSLETAPGGHTQGYDTEETQEQLFQFFLMNTRRPHPDHVTITTTRLKYGRLYWASIDQLQFMNQPARLDAQIGDNTVSVTTDNVAQYTLRLDSNLLDPAKLVTIRTNGVTNYTGPVATVTLYALINKAGGISAWTQTDPTPGVLHKTAGLEGPIGDAYTSRFLLVYGTAGNATEMAANLAEANTFCTQWNSWMLSDMTPRKDTSITTNEMAVSNLILFGTEETNSIMRVMRAGLPIHVMTGKILVGTRQYVGNNYGAYFIAPNPLNHAKYVVISHKIIPGSREKDLEALPWYWPDYVIFDTTKPAGACIQSSLAYLPDTFVDAGYFTRDWTLPGSAPALSGVECRLSPEAPVLVGQHVQLTATPHGGVLPEYRIRVGTGIGAGLRWTTVRGWTRDQNYLWTPKASGSYTLAVDARESGQTNAFIFTAQQEGYLVVPRLSAVTVRSNPATTISVGKPILLTAQATGGCNVEYQFLSRLVNSTTWVVLRDWSTNAGYADWSPGPGSYQLKVYAREHGSAKPYDVCSAASNYTITPCFRIIPWRRSVGPTW